MAKLSVCQRSIWLVAILALAIALSAKRATAGDPELERFRNVLSAIRHRHDSYNPVLCTYHVQQYQSPYYFAGLSGIDPADVRLMKTIHEQKSVASGELARKGTMSLDKWEGPLYSGRGELLVPHRSSTFAYDGKLLVATSSDARAYTISRSDDSMRRENPLNALNGEGMLLNLYDYDKAGKLAKAEVNEIPNLASVKGAAVRFRIALEKSSYEVWLTSADKGSCVLRLEKRPANNNLSYEIDKCQYGFLDGIYYLKSAVWKHYYHKGELHQVAEVMTLQVDKISFRAADIDDARFKLPIPPGSEIIDRDLNNQRVTDPAEVERHIQAAVEDAERGTPRGRNWAWLYLAGSGIMLAAVAALLVRHLRRRPLATPS